MINSLPEEVKENHNIEEETISETLRKVSKAKDEELYRRYRTLMSDPILPNIPTFDSNNNSFHDDDNNNFPEPVSNTSTPTTTIWTLYFYSTKKIEQKQNKDLGGSSILEESKGKDVCIKQ